MKSRIITVLTILCCIGLSQIEDMPKAAKQAAPAPEPELNLGDDLPIEDITLRGDPGTEGLEPENIKFPSGRKAWKVTIPGNMPLATVAYDDGMVFVGGGYGSYEFYAFEAQTGKLAWMFKTGDDGPTAAVAKKGYVVFNTESCIIYVLKAKTGEKVWEKWLGDPLMSQPAIDEKYVYMAYPGSDGHHHLACMTLEHGKEVWDVPIAGDLISAPIIEKNSVYITCFDGTVYRYHTSDGKLVWSQKNNATCAPTIVDDRIFVSLRDEVKVGDDSVVQYEGIATLSDESGIQEQSELWAKRAAPYLVYGRTSANTSRQAELDASVGFGSAPGTAKIHQAQENVGQGSVVGCWAYQGSRPVIRGGLSFNAMGNEIQAVDINDGKVKWTNTMDDVAIEGLGGRFFSPPSYANNKLFLGSGTGEVFCLNKETGKLLWKEQVKGSISFQPAIAHGVVFVSCDNGTLYGIESGDKNDDGWYMWGGNSEHNK
jgi:Ca-activated chloride channel family protein